jgi:hypothetical protein
MSLQSILKALGKAIPVIIANAPAVIGAAMEVRRAVRKPKPKEPAPALEPAAGGMPQNG